MRKVPFITTSASCCSIQLCVVRGTLMRDSHNSFRLMKAPSASTTRYLSLHVFRIRQNYHEVAVISLFPVFCDNYVLTGCSGMLQQPRPHKPDRSYLSLSTCPAVGQYQRRSCCGALFYRSRCWRSVTCRQKQKRWLQLPYVNLLFQSPSPVVVCTRVF